MDADAILGWHERLAKMGRVLKEVAAASPSPPAARAREMCDELSDTLFQAYLDQLRHEVLGEVDDRPTDPCLCGFDEAAEGVGA